MKLFSKGRGRKPKGFKELEEKVEAMPEYISDLTNEEQSIYLEYLNHIITDKEKRALRYYVNDDATIGNKLRSYAKAYNLDIDNEPKDMNNAKKHSYPCFNKRSSQHYIECLYAKANISEASVVNRLKYLIDQADDKKLSLDAIKHYDTRKGKIKSKIEFSGSVENKHTHNIDFDNLSTDDLSTLVAILSKVDQE